MRRLLFTLVILFYAIASPQVYNTMVLHPEQNYIMLEDFQSYGNDPFSGWQARDSYENAIKIYSIMVEGDRKFLRASTLEMNKSIQIGRLINENKLIGSDRIWWDIYKYPFISWEWRIQALPAGGNEDSKGKNDSAAGFYVLFQRKRVPGLDWQNQPSDWIKYVWSTTLPVGKVVYRSAKKMGVTLYEGRYVVVASGKKNMKKWVTVKRNVLEDYRNLFGRDPKFQPSVIGILTDSNNTHSSAMADYDNIMVSAN